MKVSVVIPTYNEEMTILAKLENTFQLNYPKEYMEIVISDSSNDRTVDLVNEFFSRRGGANLIMHHTDERRGVAYADNLGFSSASGDIVVRTDADVLLDENALIHALNSFRDVRIGCVTGRPYPLGSSHEKKYRDINTKIQEWESKIDSTLIAHGPFTAFRRELFRPIDEDSLADDSEISIKVRKQGYRCIINPQIIFYEKTSEVGRDEQKIRRASGLIRLLWRNKSLIFNPRYGKYGMIIFPFNFILIIIAPILLSPILLLLMALNLGAGTILETEQFLLKGMYRLISNKATIYWEQDKYIRGQS